MPQHLWREVHGSDWRIRVCEACEARQLTGHPPYEWPHISPICPGDPDDSPRGASRRRPLAPAGGAPPVRIRELEPA